MSTGSDLAPNVIKQVDLQVKIVLVLTNTARFEYCVQLQGTPNPNDLFICG